MSLNNAVASRQAKPGSLLLVVENVLSEHFRGACLKRIMLFFKQVKLVELPASVIRQFDAQEKSFQNINTPEDYFRLRGTLIAETEIGPQLKRGNEN